MKVPYHSMNIQTVDGELTEQRYNELNYEYENNIAEKEHCVPQQRYTSIRLVRYNTYMRLNFIRNIHKLTRHTKTREEPLRQLCKRFYKGQDGSSAQQSTATHSSSLQGLWRRQTVAYEQRHHTQTYMNSSVLRLLGPLEIEASSSCSRPVERH